MPFIKHRFLKYGLFTIIGLALCYLAYRQFPPLYTDLSYTSQQQKNSKQWQHRSIWLEHYHVVLEAKPVAGISNNLSALTWNNTSKTLFGTVNSPPQIVELSTDGTLLRKIDLIGVIDPESIEYVKNEQFLVVDERTHQLILFTIKPDTQTLNSQDYPQMTIGTNDSNSGIEGIAFDHQHQLLYAAKEKDPLNIYEITGFPADPKHALKITVTKPKQWREAIAVSDLSGLAFSDKYQHLLLLSDESKLLLEMSPDHKFISRLSLKAGNHGLVDSIRQPEGIAIDNRQTIYIVSEPNLFYVFKKSAG